MHLLTLPAPFCDIAILCCPLLPLWLWTLFPALTCHLRFPKSPSSFLRLIKHWGNEVKLARHPSLPILGMRMLWSSWKLATKLGLGTESPDLLWCVELYLSTVLPEHSGGWKSFGNFVCWEMAFHKEWPFPTLVWRDSAYSFSGFPQDFGWLICWSVTRSITDLFPFLPEPTDMARHGPCNSPIRLSSMISWACNCYPHPTTNLTTTRD